MRDCPDGSPGENACLSLGSSRSNLSLARLLSLKCRVVGKTELLYGQFGRLIVVSAETPSWTNAGRSGTRLG